MINCKADLKEYLEADKISLSRREGYPTYTDLVWRFERILRYCEYYTNCGKNPIDKIMLLFWKWRKYVIGTRCNFSIPLNSIGKGLSIAHMGPIIINPYATIGENCRLHVGVNIGTAAGTEIKVPVIGNNVYIGPGVKIFGSITIADGVAIGANAVVNRDCLERDVTLVGIPARVSSHKGSKGLIVNY